MTDIRIGSLFSGIGGLDLAVEEVFGGSVAWHVQYDPKDRHQYAAHALAHRWPGVPNLGDITRVDFTKVEPVDILCGGFPCQDVSLAGLGAGLAEGTRSGLWLHMARAIRQLRPRLVVIENVEGLLSAKAVRDLGSDPGGLGEGPGAALPLRALGAVLGDLAGLRFDAEWARVAASEIGAAHQRKRVFILAWPASSDPHDIGQQRPGTARPGAGPAHRCGAASDTGCGGRGAGEPHDGAGKPDVARRGAAANAAGLRLGDASRSVLGNAAAPAVAGGADWGAYEEAVTHWTRLIGRAVPRAVDARGRLAPAFVEWMMGLPEGHVTAISDLPRRAQLKALGNGVVPQQAAAALRLLLARAGAPPPAVVPV